VAKVEGWMLGVPGLFRMGQSQLIQIEPALAIQ
jgi:hypothetical protein